MQASFEQTFFTVPLPLPFPFAARSDFAWSAVSFSSRASHFDEKSSRSASQRSFTLSLRRASSSSWRRSRSARSLATCVRQEKSQLSDITERNDVPTYLFSSQTREGHREKVVIVGICTSFGIGIFLLLTILIDGSCDMSLGDFRERSEVFLAKLGDNFSSLAVRENNLLLDDALDEASLVRKAIVYEFEFRNEMSLQETTK